ERALAEDDRAGAMLAPRLEDGVERLDLADPAPRISAPGDLADEMERRGEPEALPVTLEAEDVAVDLDALFREPSVEGLLGDEHPVFRHRRAPFPRGEAAPRSRDRNTRTPRAVSERPGSECV